MEEQENEKINHKIKKKAKITFELLLSLYLLMLSDNNLYN